MFSGNNKYLYLLIILVVMLPAALFTLVEFSSLQQNEKVIEEAYEEQLNAILFSINQYSDDVLISTIREIDNSLKMEEHELAKTITKHNFIKHFFLLNESLPDSLDDEYLNTLASKSKDIISNQDSIINRLKDFYRVPYYRAEPFILESTACVLFVFIVEKENKLSPAGIVVDAHLFINQWLDPQIQQISAEKFNIVVLNKSNQNVYRSSPDSIISSIEITAPIEAFSEFKLGIGLKGVSINSILKKRTKTNLVFILIICLVLLFSGILVIRIFKRQIELSNLKSDFVSNVSHEIRTPLSLINMYAETIDMGRASTPELQKEYIQIILKEINRLSTLVNKILNFSQIENEKKSYQLCENNLNTIAIETFNNYIPYLEKLGFTYKMETDSQINPQNLDPGAVKDLIVNLLDNAIKYSFEKKQVILRTGTINKMNFLEIEDAGIGISEKNLKNIFDKFYRVSQNDVSVKVKGSGLGLSIVKHIVDAHKGKIEITSKEHTGSKFRVYFPENF